MVGGRLSCRRNLAISGLALIVGWVGVSGVAADQPEIRQVFPPGAARGQTTEIQFTGSFDPATVRVWCSCPGAVFSQPAEDGTCLVQLPADLEPGTVWLRLVDDRGASKAHRFVIGHLPEIREVEPNDRAGQAQAVPELPIVINGQLQARGDVDHFQVDLQSRQTLVARVDAQWLESAVDASLQIVDPAGQIHAQNLDYHGLDPLLVWTAPADGPYVVRVFGHPAQPDSTIALGGGPQFFYRLQLTTGPYLEASQPLAVHAHQVTELRLEGWNLESPQPHSIPAAGEKREQVIYRPGMVGTLTLPVLSVPLLAASEVGQVGSPEQPVGEGPVVALPCCLTGNRNTPGEWDEFWVDVESGQNWSLQVAARQLGYPWDPVLELRREDGSLVHREDDSGGQPDPHWVWSVAESGRYRIRVFDLHGAAGEQQWYRLLIQPVTADFSATVAEDRFRGAVDQAVEIPITVLRQNGFADVLEFRIQNAPSFIKWQTVRSVAGEDSAAKVVMQLQSDRPWSGPLQIEAQPLPTPPPEGNAELNEDVNEVVNEVVNEDVNEVVNEDVNEVVASKPVTTPQALADIWTTFF